MTQANKVVSLSIELDMVDGVEYAIVSNVMALLEQISSTKIVAAIQNSQFLGYAVVCYVCDYCVNVFIPINQPDYTILIEFEDTKHNQFYETDSVRDLIETVNQFVNEVLECD